MFLTEKEFQKFMLTHPNVKFLTESRGRSEPHKTAKYWNAKVYIHADKTVSEVKDEVKHGKIIAVFDSRKEYRRYQELLLLERQGLITNLSRQTTLIIQEAFNYGTEHIRAITYRADFTYKQNGEQIIEDVKYVSEKTGKIRSTADFKLKWKLLKKKYPSYKFVIY